jgi:uncharacterized membrane protein (DUF2068 family)
MRAHPGKSTIDLVKRERGLAVIIGYKLGKGGLWLVFVVVLFVAMHMGLSDRMLVVADHLRLHARAWSLRLAELLVSAATRRGLWTIIVALLADGTFSLVEAWALLSGKVWGKWLVVISTSALLPFEAAAFVEHPHAVRAALFVLNVLIVVYLAGKALREGPAVSESKVTLD